MNRILLTLLLFPVAAVAQTARPPSLGWTEDAVLWGIYETALQNVTTWSASYASSNVVWSPNGWVFDGSTVYYGNPHHLDQTRVSAFTVAAWLSLTSTGAAQCVVGMGDASGIDGQDRGWALYVSASGRPSLFLRTANTLPNIGFVGQQQLPLNQLLHLVLVRDRDSTGQWYIYVNGALDSSGPNAGLLGDVAAFGAERGLGVGMFGQPVAILYEWPLRGTVHSVVLYPRALTAMEIAELYSRGAQ